MGAIGALLASTLFRKVLVWGAITAVGYFLGSAVIDKVSETINNANLYQQAQQEAREANQQLIQAKADAKAEVDRMQSDRDSLTDRINILKARAKLEQQEYERLLASKPENKTWSDTALPDDIKRLRNSRLNKD